MPDPTRNILFLTNSERGQCNIALAVAEEFLLRNEFAVHIASYHPLAASVDELNKSKQCVNHAIFHEIPGPCMEDLAIRSGVGLITHKPGITGTIKGFQNVNRTMSSWAPSEYSSACRRCVEIIHEVNPVVVVLDPILYMVLDACQGIVSPLVILWPVPLKDILVFDQPNGRAVWQYPIAGSGYPYPLPWTLILPNVYLALRAALFMATRQPPETKNSEEGNGPSPFPLKNAYQKEFLHLTPAFREIDFPFRVPPNVMSCGPILKRHLSLSDADPLMESWLKRPTILISLGSHVRPTEDIALEMAKAIQILLGKHTDIQVLWKLQYNWQESVAFKEIIGALIDSGFVMVVSWIQAAIIAVLETGKISAYVHHGGANSYFEACKAGVPQVILPQWIDTYDCATRVEWLEIGAHGNRKTAPNMEAIEFSDAMDKVLSSARIRAKANAIKELCKTTEGRVFAHDRIAGLAS